MIPEGAFVRVKKPYAGDVLLTGTLVCVEQQQTIYGAVFGNPIPPRWFVFGVDPDTVEAYVRHAISPPSVLAWPRWEYNSVVEALADGWTMVLETT